MQREFAAAETYGPVEPLAASRAYAPGVKSVPLVATDREAHPKRITTGDPIAFRTIDFGSLHLCRKPRVRLAHTTAAGTATAGSALLVLVRRHYNSDSNRLGANTETGY